MSEHEISKDQRLRFLGLSEARRKELATFAPLLEKNVDDVLDDFYEHLKTVPGLAAMVGDRASVSRLKSAQHGHWARLFGGRFDDAYVQGVRRIGEAHYRIGLEPSWYIGGYAKVLGDLIEIAISAHRRRPARAAETVRAILAAVFLDMDLALDVYLKAIERERAARMEKLGALIADFDRTANEVFGTVGEAAQRIGEVVDLIDAIAGIGKTIAEVNDIATAIAAAVEQQGAATDEIARNVQEAAKGTQEVSGNIAGVNKAASETGGSAEKALGTARTVTAQTDALKDTIEGFLSEVKAA